MSYQDNPKSVDPSSTTPEGTFDLLETYDQEIGALAEQLGLDTYLNQIGNILSEQNDGY